MDKKQFMTIMAGLKSNYPNWKMDLQDKTTLTFWYENLKDIPYEVAQLGVRKLLAEEEYYPNIAKIRKACASVTTEPATDSTEAWGLVQKAIRRYGYMRADEAMESLPKDVARAVQYMGGFLALCESANVEADRAHFYRTMEQITKRNESDSALGIELKQAIENQRLEHKPEPVPVIEEKAPILLEEVGGSGIDDIKIESLKEILSRQLGAQ